MRDSAPPKSEIEWAKSTPDNDRRLGDFKVYEGLNGLFDSAQERQRAAFARWGWTCSEPDRSLATILAQNEKILARLSAGKNPKLASPAEARAYLGNISRQTWDRYVRPNVSSVRVGERDFYNYEELDRWEEQHRVGPSNGTLEQRTISSASRMPAAESSDPAAQRIAERLKASRSASTKKSPKSGK